MAQYYTIKNYVTTPKVLILDDDTMLHPKITLKKSSDELTANSRLRAVAFTIQGVQNPTLAQEFQHMEYLLHGLVKIFQAKYGSVMACHGAIGLWKTDSIIEALEMHNTEFDGEDVWMSMMLFQSSDNKRGYYITVNADYPICTIPPDSFIIPGTNTKLAQGGSSWDFAAFLLSSTYAKGLVGLWERPMWVLKLFWFLELWTQLQDYFRLIFFWALWREYKYNPTFVAWVVAFVVGFQWVQAVLFARVVLAHRPDLRVPTKVVLGYPIYNLFLLFVRQVGLWYFILISPWKSPPKTIAERLSSPRPSDNEIPPKVEIDNIPADRKEDYWNKIWKSPQDAFAILATYVPPVSPVARVEDEEKLSKRRGAPSTSSPVNFSTTLSSIV